MKNVLIVFIALLAVPMQLQAQKAAKPVVNVNKDGLVLVNGKNAFYLVSKSIIPWETDYTLQDLQHNQLAYLKFTKGYSYSEKMKTNMEVQYYVLTFSKEGAHCEIRNYMNKSNTITKSLAMVLVEAGIVKNGVVDEAAKKRFVEANKGFMTPNKADTTAKENTISNSAVPHADDDSLNGLILLKENYIYYEQQIIGTYKKTEIDTDLVLIQVYSVNRNKVAEVTHAGGEDEWRIVTLVDQKRARLPYDKEAPLKELFRYLLKKRYL